MKNTIKTIFLTLLLSVGIFAQTDTDEYKRNEFYAGYSFQRADNFGYENFNGGEAAYVRNVSRYVGIKGDVSAAYRKNEFSAPIFLGTTNTPTAEIRGENTRSIYNFLGGIQIKDNASRRRFKPFAHALAGVAINRYETKNVVCTFGTCPAFATQEFSINEKGFSAAFGGGLDIKLSRRIDFRAIQFDYNPNRSFDQWNHNFRFGIGFVFK